MGDLPSPRGSAQGVKRRYLRRTFARGVGCARKPGMAVPVSIRPARRGETPALGALCVRSKAHWGYDAEFMRLSHRSLQIDAAAIDAGRVLVATDEHGGLLGVADCCSLPQPGAFDLLHLFVDPRALRQGVGR